MAYGAASVAGWAKAPTQMTPQELPCVPQASRRGQSPRAANGRSTQDIVSRRRLRHLPAPRTLTARRAKLGAQLRLRGRGAGADRRSAGYEEPPTRRIDNDIVGLADRRPRTVSLQLATADGEGAQFVGAGQSDVHALAGDVDRQPVGSVVAGGGAAHLANTVGPRPRRPGQPSPECRRRRTARPSRPPRASAPR
jgi:hypothetical protein